MHAASECIPCLVRQAAEAIELSGGSPGCDAGILKLVLERLAAADWSGCAPELAQEIHRIIRRETGNDDPYRTIRERMNRAALAEMAAWRGLIAKSFDSKEAIVRLAAAGNLLDSAARSNVLPEDIPQLSSLWTRPLIGDPLEVFRLAERATRILYLADNAGEIVFDRLLIEALPSDRLTLAVRGAPILNDALVEDAVAAGITRLSPVIGNGSDAPGTLLADCSPEFREHFHRADLIIAKGQGNYESLDQVEGPIVFLFTVKCPPIARQAGHPVGSLIVKKTARWRRNASPEQGPVGALS